jgi:hypothetical protein
VLRFPRRRPTAPLRTLSSHSFASSENDGPWAATSSTAALPLSLAASQVWTSARSRNVGDQAGRPTDAFHRLPRHDG